MSREDIANDPTVKQELRDLEGIIPESKNRRRFLQTTIASALGIGLAGCTGGGDGDDGGDGGMTNTGGDGGDGGGGTPTSSGQDIVSVPRDTVIYRNTWHAEADYTPGFAADLKGYWNRQNIRPVPTAAKGFGSGDTAKRIGVGKEMLGQGAIDPVVGGLIEGYKLKVIGGVKTRGTLALMYRKDKLESPLDLAGKTVLVESAYEQNTISMLLDVAGVNENELKVQISDPSAAYALLARGDADAIWGTMGNIPAAEAALEGTGVELGAEPLYNHIPVYGYVMYAHTDFLSENPEYVTRVLAGYSHALGWVMLNPREAAEFMRNDVNQALKTIPIETSMNIIKVALIATNLTEEAKEIGLTAISEDKLQTTYDRLTEALNLGNTPPSVEDTANFSIQANAKLRKFTKDEWNQASESAQRYVNLYSGGI